MILSIEGLTFGFSNKKIFEHISLEISNPGIYGLVAPNGYGKTTFLNILANFYFFKTGEIKIFNQRISEDVIFNSLYFAQDSQSLYDYLSAYQHMTFICDIHKLPYSKIHEVCGYLEMLDYYKEKVARYSTGMRQRTLLAMALLINPDILLLDEPLNGLDPTSTILIREAILTLAREGKTIIVSSHDLNELDKMTDQIFFIKDQNIWLEDITSHQKNMVLIEACQSASKTIADLLKSNGFDYTQTDSKFKILGKSSTGIEIFNLLSQHQIQLVDFDKIHLGAEERYKELYREG